MSGARQKLESIIQEFSVEKFTHFFREKSRRYRVINESYDRFNDDDFKDGLKLGEIDFEDGKLLVCAFEVTKDLSERRGKKTQYEKAKSILKSLENQAYSAGIFIFYDSNGNFRFSLIYDIPKANGRRDWNNYRRFTYFVSSDPKITNKTFLKQIGDGDFSFLEKVKEAFSVEPVTKQFYQEISNWYFWAVKNVRFPDDIEKEPNGRNMAVIRLITRIIFIWFMKERKLTPNELFDEKNLIDILEDFHPSKDNYYKAILQNLFFATLNTRQDERRFRSDKRGYKGYNTDFGNHNVYRYEYLFKNSEEAIEKYFLPIPFLNGGLFECLDYKSKNKEERKYIDGFTDLKKYQPQVPNYLFFAEEEITDLSKDYDDAKYEKTKVKGLIKTLSQYNFTIDENEPDDIEIALDPELLGKVFENLLASYNPETATTARKATGSYYTPREIVDYMVDESLKEYFKTHIPEIEEEKLNKLFAKEDSTNPFDIETTIKLINLIDALRIVDPAVGSGAFPMRVLSRLVSLLHKLDPDNSQWKKIQIDAILKSVKDPILQKELINQVEKRFKEKNPDYGRKLYLIEKCIYGVDIQQIAVEIAKLRFFISLLVDERIDFDKKDENYGIEPLPNLDFKIMQGNSLISSFYEIYFKQEPESKNMLFELDERPKPPISEFEELKSQYQNEPDVFKKQDLRKKIDEKIVQIFEEKLNEHLPEIKQIEEKASQLPKREDKDRYIREEEEKLFKKLGFDLEKAKEDLIAYTEGRKEKNLFFWDIYFAEVFAEKGGFDIVIGNPPYIDSENMVRQGLSKEREYISKNYYFARGNWDIYIAFFEKGFGLLNNKGILTFITPDKWLTKPFGEEMRKSSISKISSLVRCGRDVFESSNVDAIISIFSEKAFNNVIKIYEFQNDKIIFKNSMNKSILTPPYNLDFIFSDYLELLLKIEIVPLKLSDFGKCENACATSDAYKLKPLIKELKNKTLDKEIFLKVINTGTIGKYYSKWGKREMTYLGNKYVFPVVNKNEFIKTFNDIYKKRVFSPKIVIKGLTLLEACIDLEGLIIPGKSTLVVKAKDIPTLKLLLAIINSKLASFYLKEKYPSYTYNQGINFTKEMVNSMPIPKISNEQQKLLITLADQILSAKKQKPEAATSQLEKEIDQLVYKLYGLTPEEIEIVENFAKEKGIN
jgi:hypothetical protein